MKSRISVPQSTSLCIKQNERVKGPNDSVVSVRGTHSLPSMHAIITCHVACISFEGQKRLSLGVFFGKILALCTVNIQEWVMMACIWYMDDP